MARRSRQVIDLYTTGKVVELIDGSPVWITSLNPFEQDTARNEAQIARARLSLALKEFGSDEQTKVRMFFFEDGPEEALNKLIDAKVAEQIPKVVDNIRNDPEWTDRMAIIERGLDESALPIEGIEQELFDKLTLEYATEMGRRIRDEREYLHLTYDGNNEEEIWEAYLSWYTDRRVNEVMMAEFRLHQLWFATRLCDAVRNEHGEWNHTECAGHDERLFLSKDEARGAPEQLQSLLMGAFDELELTVREAKNSDRQGSSSDSSLLPSEVGESTASIPTETRAEPPGISSSPSLTPSPSSGGVS